MPSSPLGSVYANDEDLCRRCGPADWKAICPTSNRMAAGADGAFAPGVPWAFTSASTDWLAQGVTPGMVIEVLRLRGVGGLPTIAAPSEFLAIDTVTSPSITLRRLGRLPGVGYPPGPPAGLSGITFAVPTLSAEIEDASYEVNHRIGIVVAGPGNSVRSPGNLLDARELNQACVLTVLRRQYIAMARAAGDGGDDLAAKAKHYSQELDNVLDRLIVHWTQINSSSSPSDTSTSRFGMRMSR